jgi:hypothetical protein
VVGNGQGVHAQLGGSLDRLVETTQAVEQTVLGVNVEVGEAVRQSQAIFLEGIEKGFGHWTNSETYLYPPPPRITSDKKEALSTGEGLLLIALN